MLMPPNEVLPGVLRWQKRSNAPHKFIVFRAPAHMERALAAIKYIAISADAGRAFHRHTDLPTGPGL